MKIRHNINHSESNHELYTRLKRNVEFNKIVAELIKWSRVDDLPYQHGHLIKRIIYDKTVGGRWEHIIKPHFVDNCSIIQLEQCIDLANVLLLNKTLFITLCEESKEYRKT